MTAGCLAVNRTFTSIHLKLEDIAQGRATVGRQEDGLQNVLSWAQCILGNGDSRPSFKQFLVDEDTRLCIQASQMALVIPI